MMKICWSNLNSYLCGLINFTFDTKKYFYQIITSIPLGRNDTLLFLNGTALESTGEGNSSNLALLHNSLALLEVVMHFSLLSTISSFFTPELNLLAPFITMEDFLGFIFLDGSSMISIVFGISSSSYSSSSLDEIDISRPGSFLTLLIRISIIKLDNVYLTKRLKSNLSVMFY